MGRVGGAYSCDNQILGGFQPGRSAPWKVSEKWAWVVALSLGKETLGDMDSLPHH